MAVDPEILNLQRSIQQRKVARGLNSSFEQRLREGADLFDENMRWVRGMIAAEHPEYSSSDVEHEIERRKQIAKRIDDAGLYQPCGTVPCDV